MIGLAAYGSYACDCDCCSYNCTIQWITWKKWIRC